MANLRPAMAILPSFSVRSFHRGGVCLEKDAVTLRNFGPWKAWIKTIRSYGEVESDALEEQEEALILAQAMEDHGCGFLAHLSSQNMSLGGCFRWSNKFDWEFKTVEFFCPLTCGCAKETSDHTSCPKPFGKNCDELDNCLTMDEQHFCPGFNAEVIEFLISYDVVAPQVLYAALGTSIRFYMFALFFRVKHGPFNCLFGRNIEVEHPLTPVEQRRFAGSFRQNHQKLRNVSRFVQSCGSFVPWNVHQVRERDRPFPSRKKTLKSSKKNLLKNLLSSVQFWLQEFPLSAVVPPSVLLAPS